jgi:hypothetical protein
MSSLWNAFLEVGTAKFSRFNSLKYEFIIIIFTNVVPRAIRVD